MPFWTNAASRPMAQRPDAGKETGMKRWLRWGLQLLSLLLFALLLVWAGPEAWHQVATGNPKHLLFSLLLLGLASMVSAVRLQTIAGSIAEQPLPGWPRFYHLNMTTRALGLIIPRSLSTLAGKSLGLVAFGLPLKRATWIVIVDNAFDLCLLGMLVAPALLHLQQGGSTLLLVALLLGAILILAGIIWWITAKGRWHPLARWLNRLPWPRPALRTELVELLDSLPRTTAMRALGLSILLNTALAFCYYQIARAVGLSHPWPIFVCSYPITQLSLVLAFTPGGLGILDASWYGVLLLGGIPQQEALNFVVAQRAYVFLFVLLCAGFSALLTMLTERRDHA